MAGGAAGDKRQRWSDLPDGDFSDASSRDRLATVDDSQRELAGYGWFGVGCHWIVWSCLVSTTQTDNASPK
jgi:hypothetical protein